MTHPRRGPFDVVGTLGATDAGEVLVGFDRALRRNVWLHTVTPGTPPVAASRRDCGRPGRLRWLGGQRTAGDAWDAYEALDGAPLAAFTHAARWAVVKHWIVDLARELDACAEDGSTPRLALDRVWITRANHAVLLDFRAPGAVDAGDAPTSPQAFLQRVATCGLGGRAMDRPETAPRPALLPASARAAMDAWGCAEPPPMPNVLARASALARGTDRVTRTRRAMAMSLADVPLVVALIMLLLSGLPVLLPITRDGVLPMVFCLTTLDKLDRDASVEADQQRQAVETYAAGHFGPLMADDAFWQDRTFARLAPALRPLARRALIHHPSVSAQELTKAAVQASTAVGDDLEALRTTSMLGQLARTVLGTFAGWLVIVAYFVPLLAFATGSGVWFRLLGVAVVTRDGAEVSRRRALWRSVVTWSPMLLLGVWLVAWGGVTSLEAFEAAWEDTRWISALIATGALLTGAVWAIVHPARGLQDRVAGTWLVPR